MKLLFYINILSDGGAERVIANLANYFVNKNDYVVLVNTFKTDNEYEVSSKVKRYYLESKNNINNNFIIRNLKRIIKLRKIIKYEKPDVVISFMREPNTRMLLATLGLKNIKKIISVRVDPAIEYGGKFGYLISKLILPLSDGYVFQTKEAKSWFSTSIQAKSKIIMNPVQEVFFLNNRKPISGKIVSLGRLAKQKNHLLLIKSFNLIKDKFPYITLEIYGVGDEYQNISNLIESLNLRDRVFLRGRTHNPEKVLEIADIFVLSSDFEGMPNALMEAMAAGLPCIATDCPCGGPKALINNYENGILTEVNNELQLANAISYLLSNKEQRFELGKKAKQSSLIFKPNVVLKQWDEFISKVFQS